MIGRRKAIGLAIGVGLGSVPWCATAQEPARNRRIGFISLRTGPGEFDAAFRDALHQLGYIEGRTLEVDYRWAADSASRAQQLAAELVARKVEVIVAATTIAVRAAMRATPEIPIVMAVAADPVASGLVASLAKPGGNVTGLSLVSTDTGAKRLQLLRELVPGASRVAVLMVDRGAPDDAPLNARLVGQLQAAARRLDVSLHVRTIAGGSEIADAMAQFGQEQAQALILPVNSLAIENAARLTALAAQHRLPTMYELESFVAAGGLLSYGPNLIEMYRRAAVYVDRIFKGANPADLPVEEPAVFRLAVNLKAAQALGIVVPPSLLARADEVIE